MLEPCSEKEKTIQMVQLFLVLFEFVMMHKLCDTLLMPNFTYSIEPIHPVI